MAALEFADAQVYDLAQEKLNEDEGLGRWSRVLTGPEVDSLGRVASTLVLFQPAPDELAEKENR